MRVDKLSRGISDAKKDATYIALLSPSYNERKCILYKLTALVANCTRYALQEKNSKKLENSRCMLGRHAPGGVNE